MKEFHQFKIPFTVNVYKMFVGMTDRSYQILRLFVGLKSISPPRAGGHADIRHGKIKPRLRDGGHADIRIISSGGTPAPDQDQPPASGGQHTRRNYHNPFVNKYYNGAQYVS